MRSWKNLAASLLLPTLGALTPLPVFATPSSAVMSEQTIPQTFGTNIHFGLDGIERNIPMLQQAGIHWVRMDMLWDYVEKQPGQYNWSNVDTMLGALHAAGIHVIAILDYANPLYDNNQSPVSPEARAAFARYAAAAAARYASYGIVWEIYNEPNWDSWKPRPDAGQYNRMASDLTTAIRDADPNAVVVGPALAGPTLTPKTQAASKTFLAQVLSGSAAHEWDAITIHPYRSNEVGPETAGPQFAEIQGMMQAQGIDPRDVPLFASEWGYSTWDKGVDENMQAVYDVRSLLWGTVTHMPIDIIYSWQDSPGKSDDKEHRFGLLRYGPANADEEPLAKPAYKAVAQLSSLLGGYRFDRLMNAEQGVVVARYTNSDSEAYAVWARDNGTHSIALPLKGQQWHGTIVLGQDADIPLHASRANLIVGPMPMILKPAP